MKRIGIALILTLCVFFAAAEAKTYRIGMVPWIAWAPLNIADVKGFWKEQNIDVNIIILPDNLQMDKLFKDKRLDIITEMIGTGIGIAMEGFPVTVISEIDWSHGGDKLIVKKNLEPSKMKGALIGIYMNQPSLTYFLNQYLTTIGLKVSDVKLVEMENPKIVEKFISGLFNAIVTFDPEAIQAEKQGNGKLAATSAAYQGCIPEGLLVMKDVLKDIPKEDLAKILKGWIKAVKWSQDKANWKEYTDIVNRHTFKADKPYPDSEIIEMLNAVRIHDVNMLTERNKDGGGLETYLKNINTFLKENNLLKKDFEPKELFDNAVLMEILKNQ